MPQNSFDIVSQVEMPEVLNAVNQAIKEIHNRYDLKNTKSSIDLKQDEHKIILASDDEFKLKAVVDILEVKLIKRKVPVKALTYGDIQDATGSSVRQEATLQNGIPIEKAREIVKVIKQAKLKKVQASIQGDLVRVTGKNRDDLQEVMKVLKDGNLGIDFQFTNYRTN